MRTSGRQRALYFGALVIFRLGFFGLLRPSELLSLTVRQLGMPDNILLGGGASIVILIFRPKTRRYLGRRQFSMVNDPETLAWARWLLAGLGPDQRIFPGSPTELRNILKEALSFLGLSGLGLTLAGLRTGGATYIFRRDQNVGALQFLGRWRAANTLHHYLQEGMSAHILAELSQSTIDFLLSLAPRLEMARWPPRLPVIEVVPWGRVRNV